MSCKDNSGNINSDIGILISKLAEIESAIEESVSGQVDVVVDPVTSTPLLLRHAQEALIAARDKLEQEVRERTAELERTIVALKKEAEERRQVEKALKESVSTAERRSGELEAAISSIAGGVIIYDGSGKIVRINDIALNMLGLSSTDLDPENYDSRKAKIGTSKADGTPLKAEEAPYYRALHGEPVMDKEVLFKQPEREPLWVSTAASPIRSSNGEIIGAIAIFNDITERKQAEEALRESQALLSAITDDTTDLVFVKDRQSRIVFANPAVIQMIGKPREAIMGKCDREFYDDPEIGEAIMANDRRIMESGQTEVIEEMAQTPYGYRTYLSTKTPYRNNSGETIGIIGIARDITERKQAEEERQRLLQELEVHSKELQEANEQLAAVNEELAASNDELRSTTEELQKARNELELRVRERTFELSEAKENLEEINKQLQVEISEHEMTEKDLMAAKVAAEAAVEAKAAFLANMSHELRTPLNAVIGFSSLLLEDNLTQDQKEYIERIRVGGESLLALISDILEFSKAEKRKITLEHQPLSLKHCIEESMELVAVQANDKGLNLAYTVNYGTPDAIIGDPGRLRQVLANLLSNAVKFTDVGDISISVSSKALEGNKRQITFAVKDTGIGMPQDKMDRLFKPFAQLEYVISRKRDGAGLGLAICKVLVELMGGEIWAESEEGKGSTFRFTIQTEVIPGKQLDLGKMDKATEYGNLASEKPLSILVAEDNPSNQRVLVEMLKRLGYRADAVADGREVLQALQIRPYDLIFMDIRMPEMDGLTATKEIRKLWPNNGPKIVAITAIAMDGDQEKCLEAGMDGYVAKPVKVNDIAALLRNIFTDQKE